MENLILPIDKEQEALSDADLARNLRKNEHRLSERLLEAQEDEVKALEHFQRAQAKLESRRKRVERIQGKLVLVRESLAELHITDQHTVYAEPELIIATTSESAERVHSEEVTLVQPEQAIAIAYESEHLSSPYAEPTIPGTSVPEQAAAAISMTESNGPTVDGDVEQEQGYTTPQQETPTPVSFTTNTHETMPEPEASSSSDAEAVFSNTTASEYVSAPELEASSPTSIESTTPATTEQGAAATIDSNTVEPAAVNTPDVGASTDLIADRVPTKPLESEQQDQHAASPHSLDVQSAKEAWIAAESTMQNARNTAHGIATSIAFLSQNDGLSNEFMEELVRKQADANKELLKAQDAARAAYEHFVQAQRETESEVSLPVDASNSSEDQSQQKQEDATLPPAEENGADQTAKLHAIRLYNEW